MNFLNEHRLTGILLILSFISFAIGAALPIVSDKGNSRIIYNLPMREYLSAVASNAVA
ncbi:MAG: hypothetical protein M5U01_17625 [Ardenticatenaceae bacterium]|nr:hypothetical protein [Ardenticatenaceae bacterium]